MTNTTNINQWEFSILETLWRIIGEYNKQNNALKTRSEPGTYQVSTIFLLWRKNCNVCMIVSPLPFLFTAISRFASLQGKVTTKATTVH